MYGRKKWRLVPVLMHRIRPPLPRIFLFSEYTMNGLKAKKPRTTVGHEARILSDGLFFRWNPSRPEPPRMQANAQRGRFEQDMHASVPGCEWCWGSSGHYGLLLPLEPPRIRRGTCSLFQTTHICDCISVPFSRVNKKSVIDFWTPLALDKLPMESFSRKAVEWESWQTAQSRQWRGR